jgi:hypothetical protein
MQTPNSNVIVLASYVSSKSASEGASPSPETSVPARAKPKGPRRARRSPTSLDDVHDDEIVERLALGDLDAAAALRVRYIGRLRRTATPILGDEGEVARVVESALEEACSGWPPERGQVDRWLTRLVRRAAVARKRALWGLDSSHVPESRRLRYQHLNKPRHGNRH